MSSGCRDRPPTDPPARHTPRRHALCVAGLAFLAIMPACSDCTCAVEQPCRAPIEVTVTRVIDGDTFEVEPAFEMPDGLEEIEVRPFCLDTPESDQCYFHEATDALRDRIEGQSVRLEFGDECRGKYGRPLAYVWLAGDLLNVTMAEEGFGWVHERYDYAPCCDRVREAAERAQAQALGGWGACAEYPW